MIALADLSPDERYRIVRSKDAGWDGRFVFAVRTTGIFCRPSCPAKTPLQRNVEYFEAPDAAIRAGYRACLRCHPAGGERTASPVEDWIIRLCRRLEEGEMDVDLKRLGAELGRTPSAVQRAFKAVVGVSPKNYSAALRRRELQRSLREPGTVTRAAYAAGYNSSGRFYTDSDKSLGMPPKRYKNGGAGEQIRYATAPCPFGVVLVARTARGVCAVALGDDAPPLITDLVRQFENAQVQPAEDGLPSELLSVLRTMETGVSDADLPVDIRGTAFQHRVWRALCEVPSGETRTYAQLAARVGAPDAVRAVGSACGANRLAVVVPCHRVIRADGALGGYRWGLDTKRRLLEREIVPPAPPQCPSGDEDSHLTGKTNADEPLAGFRAAGVKRGNQ